MNSIDILVITLSIIILLLVIFAIIACNKELTAYHKKRNTPSSFIHKEPSLYETEELYDDRREICITVYQSDGKVFQQFKGKFDITSNQLGLIHYEDEQGKEHCIHAQSGFIIIETL